MVRWYYSTNGKAEGPVTPEFLIDQLKAGKFTLVDLVFKEGDPAWKTFGEVPEFREAYQAPPPPAYVPPPSHPSISADEISFDGLYDQPLSETADEIAIDEFTPTPILSKHRKVEEQMKAEQATAQVLEPASAPVRAMLPETAPVFAPAPALFAAPVPAPAPAPKAAPVEVPQAATPVQPYEAPFEPMAMPESMSAKEFTKPEDGWPSDWRLSSSWIVLRKRTDGSGYEQDGPFSAEHIIEMIGQGKIEYSQYCWKPGYTRWFRIGNLPEFDRRKRDRENDTVNQIVPVPAIGEALPALTREELLANVEKMRRAQRAGTQAPPETNGRNLIETPLDVHAPATKKISAAPAVVKTPTPAAKPDRTNKTSGSLEHIPETDFASDTGSFLGAGAIAGINEKALADFDRDSIPAHPYAPTLASAKKKSKLPNPMRLALAVFVAAVVVFALMQASAMKNRQPASSQPNEKPHKGKQKSSMNEDAAGAAAVAAVAPSMTPALAPEAPRPASNLEIAPQDLETHAILKFKSDMAANDKIVVKLKGKTGEVLGVGSYFKTFEVAKGQDLDLQKEAVPVGSYFVEASVAGAQSSTQVFVGKRDDVYTRELERHIKSISLRQQSERAALFYGSQQLEKLAKELSVQAQALKGQPLKWKKVLFAWRRSASDAASPVIALAKSPGTDMTYPDQLAQFKTLAERLAAQAKELDASISQKREVASAPADELTTEFAKLREDAAKLSGRPVATNDD